MYHYYHIIIIVIPTNPYCKPYACQTEEEPLAHVHFKAEGDVEFRSILYIPKTAPPGFLDNYFNQKSALKLYVRRVFISDDFEELVPRRVLHSLNLKP